MTLRSPARGLFINSLILISSIFWVTTGAGATNSEASYSLTQAAEGRGLYAEHCASCHGMNLLGNESGPALSGKAFQDRWAARQTGVPMTYAIGGQQYIVVATGAPGEAGQLVALRLRR